VQGIDIRTETDGVRADAADEDKGEKIKTEESTIAIKNHSIIEP